MPNKENDKTIARQLHDLDQQFKAEENLIKYIEQAQNFYNGKQYPTANNNNMIRVTMNIIQMCAKTKASKICGTPIYLTFTADDMETDCTALRQFDEYNYRKLNMSSNNYQSAINGLVNGTEIVYMPWDKDDTRYKGIYKGGLNIEHIDPRNFAMANPYLCDVQRQKWVMIWEDYDVEAVLDLLEAKSEKEKEEKRKLILSDEEYDTYKNTEVINHKLVRMYTRFFRVKGEVYYMCSTDEVDLFAYPHPLSRKVSKKTIKAVVDEYHKRLEDPKYREEIGISKIEDYKIDYEDLLMNTNLTDRLSSAEFSDEKEKFSLYPFAIWVPHHRNRSFYGHSDVQDLIPTQNALNFIISMIAKCAENNAYNKIFAKKDALGNQVITNEPSQVIYDESQFVNGWGIKMAESQPMPNGLMDFGSSLLSMTRVVYGFNEVLDGTISNQDISGYAIQQMIKQANTSIEQQQQLFWQFQVDMAEIRLMYYKHYVDKAKYTTELSDAEYDGEEQAREILRRGFENGKQLLSFEGQDVDPEEIKQLLNRKTQRARVHEFRNEDIWGVNFDISIDAVQGLADSKLIEQQTFDNLFLNNGIQNMSPAMLSLYLQAAPNISPRTKAALKNVVKNLEMSENEQLKKQLGELMQYTEQIMSYAKQLEASNGYQSAYLKNLQSEFTAKINAQNKVIGGLVKQIDGYQEASEGEVKSNNAKGFGGTHVSIQ